jgi:beta-N-acetylhexosaminidase
MTPLASPDVPSRSEAPSDPPSDTPSALPSDTPFASPSTAPTPTPATPIPTPAPTCALQTLASMTEAQRIGQLFMVGLTDDRLSATESEAIAAFHFGSVLFTKRTAVGVGVVRAVSDAVQAEATQSATHGVAFFIAANQEGGLVQALSGPGFDLMPSALTQGTMSPAQLQVLAARWGGELSAAGINLDLAPVADVVPPGTDAQNAPIGELDREFGHDPATVASHVAAFIAGMRAGGVGTTAKHFPGLGSVAGNTDYSSAVVDSVTTRDDPDLQPFSRAVGAGVPFVMISLATYERIDPEHLAVFSNTVINGTLRGDLGFRGVVISDSLAATAVASMSPGTRAIDFLDAGGDMIVLNPVDQAIAMAGAIASFASTRDWFRARVDNAAWHVLRAKEAAGLLDCSN